MQWVIVGYLAIQGLGTVALIGQQRKPIEPGTAAVSVLLCALLIVGLVVYS